MTKRKEPNSMTQSFEPWGSNGEFSSALLCAGCGENNTHHVLVDVFNRSTEDSKLGTHMRIGTQDDITLSSDADTLNPSGRRNGVCIYYICEHCDAVSALRIMQHKGTTFAYSTTEDNPDIIARARTGW